MENGFMLDDRFERFIEDQIASGRYKSATEVVSTALRLLEERENRRNARLEEIRRELRVGIESGPSVPAEEVFTRLEEKYRRLAGL